MPEIRLYINGVKATNTGWQIKGYNKGIYDVFIGSHSDTNENRFVGSIDEFRIYNGVKLWDANFTPPTSSDYDTLTYGFSADVIRKVCDSSKWTYENVGVIDSLINASTAVQLTDLTADKSKTTKAFYQTKTGIKLFDVPTSNEIWIKFDVYFNGSKRWRCYDISTDVANNKTTGITAQTTGDISFFNRSTNVKQLTNLAKINQLQTVILYMKADATDGVIDVYTSDGGFIGEYVGEVNNGTAFSNLYLQSDGAGTFFSNIVISNNPLWFNDNAKVTINTDADFDTQRNILNDITVISDVERSIYKAPNVYNFDTERIILENSHDVDLVFDTARRIDITVNVDTDIERNITAEINLLCDTERLIESEITASFDVERVVCIKRYIRFDTKRVIVKNVNRTFDTERNLFRDVDFYCDTLRKIPHVVNVDDENSFLQSITININEQQLTDDVSFVCVGDLNIMNGVDLNYLDYVVNGRVEETIKKGVLQTCKCTCDIDEILFKQLAYTIQPTEYEWTGEYLNELNQKRAEYPEFKIEPEPSAAASTHFNKIASALGKQAVIKFDDWISTLSTDVKSGTNYSSLIQELFGWTSRIPNLMINCYMRDNKIYAVQRGHEDNVINLDGLDLTLHTTRRKLIRMTWGSDAWSKTEVTTYKGAKYFDELQDMTPVNLDEGGNEKEFNDDGLVHSTTVTHGDETVTTYYDYTVQENGKKFLSKETAVTYRNGLEVDKVTTIHDPVRDTQSHVYSVDDSGVLGGVVTSSNNDDRITPYNKGYSGYSDGTFLSDGKGNLYWISGVKHIKEEYEQGQLNKTLHGVALIDTSFPVEGDSKLEQLTNAIKWLDRKTEESITLDVYNYEHVIDFNDRILFNGNTYYLRSNTAVKTEKIVNKQSLEFVRWF